MSKRDSFTSPDPLVGETKRVPPSNRKKGLKGLLIFLGAVTLVSVIAVGTGFGIAASIASKRARHSYTYALNERVSSKTRYEVKGGEREAFEKAGLDVYQDETGSLYTYATAFSNKITGWKEVSYSFKDIGEMLDIGVNKAKAFSSTIDNVALLSSYASEAFSFMPSGNPGFRTYLLEERKRFENEEDNLAPVSLKRYFASISSSDETAVDGRCEPNILYSLSSTLGDLAVIRAEKDERKKGLCLYGYGFQALAEQCCEDMDLDSFTLEKWIDATTPKYGFFTSTPAWAKPGIFSPSRYCSVFDAAALNKRLKAGESLGEAFQNHYETNKLDQEIGKEVDFGWIREIARLCCGLEAESEAFLSDPENAKGFTKPYEQIAPTLEQNKEKIYNLIDKVVYILMVYRHDHARQYFPEG